MTRAKICGITRERDLAVAVEAGADAVGFIADVSVETPREVEPADAADLVAATPPLVTSVLVTMPDSPGRAVELTRAIGPDAVQLYGNFDADDVRFVRAETGAKVIPAMDYDERDRALAVDAAADAILLDSTEDGAGGTGETGDWEATRKLVAELSAPAILAGGLGPENVRRAAETVRPFAVDVASGVESQGGRKDADAVREFVREAAAVDHAEDVLSTDISEEHR
ncbi:MAG: phosphoribosylanthranilate isomerase [Halolamina sp.]